MFPDQLATDRLRIVSLGSEHAPALFERCNRHPAVTRYLTWRPHGSVEETVAFMQRASASATSRTYALVRQGDGLLVGTLRLGRTRPFAADIGYLLAPDVWGQGLMPEAIRAVAEWSLAQADVFRVGATCDTANKASARVLEKSGFEREGMLRRWVVHPNLGPEPRDAYSYVRAR